MKNFIEQLLIAFSVLKNYFLSALIEQEFLSQQFKQKFLPQLFE
jgi:hypothetical protein